MKTLVLHLVSNSKAIKGGVIRLTTNRSGNYQVEGDCLRQMGNDLKTIVTAAVHAYFFGYRNPVSQYNMRIKTI